MQVVSVPEQEDDLITGIFLSEESNDQITRLFKIIDKNNDGQLDVKDFHLTQGGIPSTQLKKWSEVDRVFC